MASTRHLRALRHLLRAQEGEPMPTRRLDMPFAWALCLVALVALAVAWLQSPGAARGALPAVTACLLLALCAGTLSRRHGGSDFFFDYGAVFVLVGACLGGPAW